MLDRARGGSTRRGRASPRVTVTMDENALGFILDELAGATSAVRFGELLCSSTEGVVDDVGLAMRTSASGGPSYALFSNVTQTASLGDALVNTSREMYTGAGTGMTELNANGKRSFSNQGLEGCTPKRQRSEEGAAWKPSTTASNKQERQGVKSHTRKCREKVNEKFNLLLEALPRPPAGVEVKHKAQILEYTIRVFKSLLQKRATLRMELALSSSKTLFEWARSTLHKPQTGIRSNQWTELPSISSLLEQFILLYCRKQNWKYAEVWLEQHHGKRCFQLEVTVVNCETEDSSAALIQFANESKRVCPVVSPQHGGGIVIRTSAACKPEWLPPQASVDSTAFTRAPLAASCGLQTMLAVPVMLRSRSCPAVITFGDTDVRKFSALQLSLLAEYANVLGDAYQRYLGELGVQDLPVSPDTHRM